MNKITFHFDQNLKVVLVFKLYCYLLVVTNRKVYILPSIVNFNKKEIKMTNFRWMRNGLAAALVAYGIHAAVDTNTGYNSVECGLRGLDTITDYAKKAAEPALNLIDESTGVNLTLNRYSFAENDNVVLRGIDKGMGLLQLAGLGVLAAGLFKKKD